MYGHGGNCKVGLGQPRIIICLNIVEPTFPMLHTMSQTRWPFDFRDDLKSAYIVSCVVAIWLCDHNICEKFHSLNLRRNYMKFDFNQPSGFCEKDV